MGLLLLFETSTCCAGQTSAANGPELRDELISRVERDQEARRAAIAWEAELGVNGIVDKESLSEEERTAYADVWAAVAEIDRDNTEWLKNIINERGWLTYSDVGIDASEAAWLLVQHAIEDPLFQRQCLDLMMSLPQNEISQLNLAILTDRVLLAEGKHQIYGTQFVIRDGEWVPLRLEDEENVDDRRAEVGLPPLAEYKAMIEAHRRGEKIE